ncbi:RNA-splicing ligase RtcB [Aliifodinibius salipaludis]|uniref:3'-phosphate/5'-hydroxy nucleic acid ligase n=1 Tax=Fodinibius salipaludis TaxID=2032627 RepID=A0A2A2GD46_9BACT|nr:RtcB family protein [Aliifodinibius salipaludis]PAU94702.1 RNA-splicing ligase RtcB [Aliifodinibius salipaludis]
MVSQSTEEKPVFGQPDENTLKQFHDVLMRAERGALMADAHVGYIMPIGGVMAYQNKVSPVGVGFDIGCGNMAVKLDKALSSFDTSAALDIIEERIQFGVGKQNPDAPSDHPIFDAPEWDAFPNKKVASSLKQTAREQLGTVGSGNHYVDLFHDEDDHIWIGVHFGSRGFGYKTARGFMNLSRGKDWNASFEQKEVLLDLDTPLGQDYFAAMNLAGRYAYAGREWVCHTLAEAFDATILDEVHNNHNFAWKEEHDGQELIVVRKGATPAFPGQRGFVGGSMGDISVILEGVESEQSKRSLFSTIHGAGRVMSRTQAKGDYRGRNLSKSAIKPNMIYDRLQEQGVELRGGGLDEAPQVYRQLNDVLNYHQDTINIHHYLNPIGVVMDGPEQFIPNTMI